MKTRTFICALIAVAPFVVIPIIYSGSVVPKIFISGTIMVAAAALLSGNIIFEGCIFTSPLNLPAGIMLCWWVLSAMAADSIAPGLRVTVWIALHAAFFQALPFLASVRPTLYRLLVWQNSVLLILMIVQIIFGIRPVAGFGNINWAASFLLILLPLNTHLIKMRGWNFLCIFNVALTPAVILASGSRGVMSALLLMTAIFLIRHSAKFFDRRFLTLLIIAVMLPCAFLLNQAVRSRMLHLLELNPSSSSISYRLMLWETAFQHWREHPILGTGPGSFSRLAAITQLETGRDNPDFLTLRTGISHAHNEYLETLSECGLPGLVLLLFIVWRLGRALFHTPEFYSLLGTIVFAFGEFPLRLPLHSLYLALITGLALTGAGLFRPVTIIKPKHGILLFSMAFLIFGLIWIKDVLNPFAAEFLLTRAERCKYAGDLPKAERLFHMASRFSPLNERAYLGTAFCLHHKGSYTASNDFLRKALKIGSSRDAFYMMGLNHYLNGNVSLALETLKVAASIENKRDKAARLAFIELALQENRVDDARMFLNELTILFPENPGVLGLWKKYKEKDGNR
ncbi:MAG: O-antigen ligase family protein [Candidatus Wallbacteria bacterium]|nr:O-antigen ligase family protein [Candidatus Wallbacteria bacterium]